MENWNPMAEAYDCRYFNSYSNGVSGNTNQRFADSSTHQTDLQPVTLYVGHVPLDMHKEGLRNIFLQYGYVLRIRLMPPREDRQRTIGFVEMRSLQEAQLAIRGVDGQPPLHLRVSVAKPGQQQQAPQVMGRGRSFNQQTSQGPSLLGPGPPSPAVQGFDAPLHGSSIRSQGDSFDDIDDVPPTRDLTLTVTVKGNTLSGHTERVVTMKPEHVPLPIGTGSTPLGQRPEFMNYSAHDSGDLRLQHGQNSRLSMDSRRPDGLLTRAGCIQNQGVNISSNGTEWSCPSVVDRAGDRLHQVDLGNEGKGVSHSGNRSRSRNINSASSVENESRQFNHLSKEQCQVKTELNSQPKVPPKQGPNLAPSGTESREKSPQRKDEKNEQTGKPERTPFRKTDQTGVNKQCHLPSSNAASAGRRQLSPNLPKDSVSVASSTTKLENVLGLQSEIKQEKSKVVSNGLLNAALRQHSVKVPSILGKNLELPLNKAVQVEVAHCVGPDHFWVNILEQKQQLTSMIINLQEKIADRHKPVTPKVGLVCAAKYTADNVWYRCRIEKVSPTGTCIIFYLDYGNSEEASVDNLCQLPEKFLLLSSQAIQCSMPDGEVYTVEETNKFCEFVLNGVLWAETQQRKGNVHVVTLSEAKPEDGENKAKLAAAVKEPVSTVNQKADISKPSEQTSNISKPAQQKGNILASSVPQKVDISKPPQQTPNFPASIISKLKVGEEVTLSVSFVESFLRFWGIASVFRYQEEAQQLLQDFHSECEAKESPNQKNCPASVKVLAAKSPSDGQWYRAYVKDTAPDGSRSVFYFDYGNGETVNSTMSLVDKFAGIPGYAVLCLVDNNLLSANGVECLKTNICIDSCLKFIVQQKESGFLVGDVLKENGEFIAKTKMLPWTAGVDTIPSLVPTVEASDPEVATLNKSEMNATTTAYVTNLNQTTDHVRCTVGDLPVRPSFNLNQVVSVVCCFLISSDELYVTLLDKASAVCEVENLLAEVVDTCNVNSGYHPQVGEVVCAKYEDDVWYRAEVLETSTNFSSVKFIDFGNVEQVAPTDLKNLPESLQQYPPLAIRVQVETNNKAEASRILQEKLTTPMLMKVVNNSNSLVVDFLNMDSTPVLPRLNASQPLAEPLPKSIHDGNVKDSATSTERHTGRFYIVDVGMMELPVGSTVDVYISSVDSPQIVFCQLAAVDELQKLGDLTDMVSHYCKDLLPTSYKPVLSELCLAKYAEDGKWYRAYCVQDLGSSCDVIFIDFGNIEKVACGNIRTMPKHLMALPCQAIHCALAHISESELQTWATELIEKLKAVLMGKVTKAKIIKKEEAVYFVEFPEFQQELLSIGIPFESAIPEQEFDGEEELRRLLEEEKALAAKRKEIEAKKKRFQKK